MATARKWAQDVTEHSHALALELYVFKSDDPKKIARSLKKSAEESDERKSESYASAMSMLTFYINRAGKNLPEKKKRVLEEARTNCENCSAASRIEAGLAFQGRTANRGLPR
jgi:putative cell wall-binding protein